MLDDTAELFGIDIVEVYDYSLDKAYNLIKDNTDYLDNISINEVKEIKFSSYKDIIILLRNGILLVNGKVKLENIKIIWSLSGTSIFAFSNDNIITCLVGESEATKFINSNNYKYKKIIITTLTMVALTYEKDIKVFKTLVDDVIDYNRYFDIDDIGYVEENEDIVVIKNDKVYSLFVKYDYSNDFPSVMVEGEIEVNKKVYVTDSNYMNYTENIIMLTDSNT